MIVACEHQALKEENLPKVCIFKYMGNWQGYQNALDVNILLLYEYIFG